MKKTKIITISMLGLLLLVPFMMPSAKAAPASYVGVAEEEYYSWIMYINYALLGQWIADNVSEAFSTIFSHDAGNAWSDVFSDWSGIFTPPQAYWPMTIYEILPEVTDDFLSGNFIFDNITHTPLSVDWGYSYWTGGAIGPSTWQIVNDTVSFAQQSLFGGMATSAYWLMGVQLGPKNIDWPTFVGYANSGMANYWGGLAANTTVTQITDGYQMSVPISGYALQNQFNNSLPITTNVTYNTDGILQAYTVEYGADLIYGYYTYLNYADVIEPEIIDSPSNFTIFEGYTGESISWTATDANAGNYTITRDVTTVVTTTNWTSGSPVVYNIPDGLTQGFYEFTIDFKDTSLQSTTHSLIVTVLIPDTTDPVITSSPADVVVESGIYPADFSWTATDANPGTYTISRNGTIVVGATSWTSGSPVNYSIEGGLQYIVGVTTYEITFYDFTGNSVSDSVTMTVNPMPPETTPPPRIPGFEPLIVIGIFVIGSISLIALKKKKK
ncbi:hypothetical protein LCGC14_1580470 [marine sediment metagenome]|uniref:Cadherin domain-containing protein n=1 Tax=marine sediment metagenome TaxID=412755 RepID=A0A0F9LH66_9ZZZZ